MIDWTSEFEKKFSNNTLINSLRDRKFHGKLVINFADGSPHTCHIDMCVKAYATTGEGPATVTKGEG